MKFVILIQFKVHGYICPLDKKKYTINNITFSLYKYDH